MYLWLAVRCWKHKSSKYLAQGQCLRHFPLINSYLFVYVPISYLNSFLFQLNSEFDNLILANNVANTWRGGNANINHLFLYRNDTYDLYVYIQTLRTQSEYVYVGDHLYIVHRDFLMLSRRRRRRIFVYLFMCY